MAAPKGNKYAVGNPNSGRPLNFKTPKELEKKINAYFKSLKPKRVGRDLIPTYPTVCGLALYLGFAQRKSLLDYKERKVFCNIIKKAVTFIEEHYEQRLNTQGCTGAIFALKNMGWADKIETDITTKGESINNGSQDLSKLTDKELRTLVELQRKSGIS
jgi:hypothetical protein